jgi:hypothetical protein
MPKYMPLPPSTRRATPIPSSGSLFGTITRNGKGETNPVDLSRERFGQRFQTALPTIVEIFIVLPHLFALEIHPYYPSVRGAIMYCTCIHPDAKMHKLKLQASSIYGLLVC